MTGPAPKEHGAEQKSRSALPGWTGPVIIAATFILATIPSRDEHFGIEILRHNPADTPGKPN